VGIYQFERYGSKVLATEVHPSKAYGNTPARFEITGIEPNRLPEVTSSDEKLVEVVHLSRKSATTCAFSLKVHAVPNGLASAITITAVNVPRAAVTMAVTVLPELIIPKENTDEGMMVRLFLAEVRGPLAPGYSESDSLLAMRWMRLVLENRLKHNPKQFWAPHAKTLTDVVKAQHKKRVQFQGFSNYPDYVAKSANSIRVKAANDDNNRTGGKVRDFIELAIGVAQGKEAIKDPSPAGRFLGGWQTENSPNTQGDGFEEVEAHGGNIFYSVEL